MVYKQDESTIEKDSDEEDNEGARQRRLQLLSLKESAYELLGNAWPREYQTQRECFIQLISKSTDIKVKLFSVINYHIGLSKKNILNGPSLSMIY